MEETPKRNAIEEGDKGGLASIGEDLLRNILSRLPAVSYAYAACVSRSWNHLCNQILSRPKLLSALSLNPCLEIAVKEAFDKVLAEPIRPHFAIAFVGREFSSRKSHQLVRAKLSPKIPIITSVARGIIGSDALTNEFREVKWVEDDAGVNGESYSSSANVNRGIVLIVGFVPGLKVCTIPLLRSREEPPEVPMVDKLVTDIKDYTTSVSGCTSPTGILVFADQYCEMKPVLDKMDYALSGETVIMGDESGRFLYSSGDGSMIAGGSEQLIRCKNTKENYKCAAVALVFATDRNKSHDMGEIQFNLALSTGLSPVGPTYKGASVRVTREKESECLTWLTARREGSLEKLDGQRILHDIDDEMGNDISCGDLYIGVTKRRKCSIGSEKGKLVSSLAFHEVSGGDEEYLYVKGDGIKTGDSFHFYQPDPETALVSRNNVLEDLRILKQEGRGIGNSDKSEVWGGLIISCYGRGESFFGRRNVDCSAFLENFPGVPLAGMFCSGEIARGGSILKRREYDRQNSTSCCLHVYSTVYLVMLYTPKPLEH